MAVTFRINGQLMTRREFIRRKARRGSSKPGSPMFTGAYRNGLASIALGCNPSQVEDFNRELAEHGKTSRYRPDGTLMLASRAERNELMRARGLHDNDAGYGDFAGQ